MGIVKRGNKLWLLFTYQGFQCREPLKLDDTPANREEAKLMNSQIKRQIVEDAFDYVKWFPNSTNLKKFGLKPAKDKKKDKKTGKTKKQLKLHKLLDTWYSYILTIGNYEKSTLKSYKTCLKRLKLKLPDKEIAKLKKYEIEEMVCSILNDGITPKTVNNTLIVLRGALNYAYDRELVDDNISGKIKNLRVPKTKVDVFTKEEVRKILDYMSENYPVQHAFFATMFMTGMRTGEALAMKWDNLNLDEGWYFVSEAITDGVLKGPKNEESVRYVLLPRTLTDVLSEYREKYSRNDTFVFTNQYGEPYATSYHLGIKYWRPVLEKLGIRYRVIYQARHTFATLSLLNTADINYVARQLGHSSHQMIFKTYGRIIKQINGEKNELDKFIYA